MPNDHMNNTLEALQRFDALPDDAVVPSRITGMILGISGGVMTNENDFTISVDVAAFIKKQMRVAADVASGRITPSQARKRNAQARSAIRAADLVMKCGQISRSKD